MMTRNQLWLIGLIALLAVGFVVLATHRKVAPSGFGTAPSQVVSTPSPPPDWRVYTNTEYGFQLTLTDAWKNYRVIQQQDPFQPGVHYLRFQVPTADRNYGDRSGYATPFTIGIWPKVAWEQLLKQFGGEIGPAGHQFATRDDQVFVESIWQDPPADLRYIDFGVPKIISSFRLIQ